MKRHDRTAQILLKYIKRHGGSAHSETRHLMPADNRRPADLQVFGGAEEIWVDVTWIMPSCPTHASKTVPQLFEQVSNAKRADREVEAHRQGARVVCFAGTVQGLLSKEARAFIDEIAQHAVDNSTAH